MATATFAPAPHPDAPALSADAELARWRALPVKEALATLPSLPFAVRRRIDVAEIVRLLDSPRHPPMARRSARSMRMGFAGAF